MTIEELQILLTANTTELRREITTANNTLDSLDRKATKTSKGVVKGFSFIKKGIIALGITAVIGAIVGSMDKAIDRVDTLNNFPKTMSNLGIGAQESQASIDRLLKGLDGLPTTINDAAISVQRFTSSNGNIRASTDMFLALNNAVIAGNAPLEMQKSAIEQLSQSYAKGKPDMMEWRTAMQAMPAQLKQVANSMGYVSADALGEDLRSGKVSMNEFMIQLMKLNREGYGEFQSFEDQARNSTGGIATSITNMRTAVTRGVADIINTIGQSNIAGFFQSITRAINATIPYILAFVKVTQMAVSWVGSLFGRTSKAVTDVGKDVKSVNKDMNSFGGSSIDASKGIDKTSKAAKKLSQIMGKLATFDELNVMNKSQESDSDAADIKAPGLDMSALNGLDFNWDEQEKGADKVAGKVDFLLGKLKGIGSFFDEYKVPIISTIAGVLAGLATIGAIGLFTSLQPLFALVGSGISLFKLWTGEMGILKGTFDLIVSAVGTTSLVIAGIVAVVALVVGALTQLWMTNDSFKESMIGAWNGIMDTLKLVYATVLAPIFTSIKDALLIIWNDAVKPLWDGWVEFVRSISMAMAELWNVALKPMVDWMITNFGPILTAVVDVVAQAFAHSFAIIGQVVGFIFKQIAISVDTIIGVFSGVIQFVRGVFTGDWEMAWNGVKKVFSTVVNSFYGVFKNVWGLITGLFSTGGKIFDGVVGGIVKVFSTIVNSIITGINTVIAAPFNTINGLLNTIRGISVLGVKPFKGLWGQNPLPVPKIPKLPAYEKGTNYVPETGVAMLHEGEQVIPKKVAQGKAYQSQDSSTSRVEILMMEAIALLSQLLDKDPNIYMDRDKVTDSQRKASSKRLRAQGQGR